MQDAQTRYTITKQLLPLAAPGTRVSRINRVFNAALGVYLDREEGDCYERLYARYMGIEPRFPPSSRDCDPWVAEGDMDDALRSMLDRGVIRFGFVSGAPYVYRNEGTLTGFDYELGGELAGIIGRHYHGDAHRMRAEWVELTTTGEDQADKLGALHRALVEGSIDVALSGQMMLPADYLGGLALEWTAPTANLFTAISYTGRDRDKLDLEKLRALRGADLDAFVAWAAAESRRLSLELRIFSVVNPGPSPSAATNLVAAIHAAGGRAVWDTGDISRSYEVMLGAADHFAVGDSLASGTQSLMQGFDGLYLNIVANYDPPPPNDPKRREGQLWPIAGFTAGKG